MMDQPGGAGADTAGGQRRLVRGLRADLRRDQRRRRDGLLLLLAVGPGPGGQAPERHFGHDLAPGSAGSSQPFIREQCQWLDYSLYHLDGVAAIRHLDALLEIEELNAIQWTPGVGQPQGGDPCWYDLYQRIRAGGKAIMPCWVELDELQPLLDAVGPVGVNMLMHFQSERDIDAALAIARITGDR